MPQNIYTTARWKNTALGSPIELHSSHPLESLQGQNPILMMGGVHGDEPEGVYLARELLKMLKSSKDSFCPWILIPCLNVDGFALHQRMNGRGVDLNRNYPSADWSPKHDKKRYFPGPHSGSEPEVQGVVELLQNYKPRLVIHFHSWNPCIVATGEAAMKDGERLARSSGYKLTPDIGYPTPGSLSRYGWHDNQIPVICIEEQDHLLDYSSIWPRFSSGLREVLMDSSLRWPN